MANQSPKAKDPNRGLTRLHDLEPAEISLVPSGANRRRILVLKRGVPEVAKKEKAEKGGPGSGPGIGTTSTGKTVYNNADHPDHKDFSADEHKEAAGMHTDKMNAANEAMRNDKTPYGSEKARKTAAANNQKEYDHHKTQQAAHMSMAANKDAEKSTSVKKSGDEGDDSVAKSLHDMIAKTSPETLAKVDKAFSDYAAKSKVAKDGATATASTGADVPEMMDAQTLAAAKAVTRILSPFKGKLPPALAHQIVDLAGFETEYTNPDDTGTMRVGHGEQTEVAKMGGHAAIDEDGDDDDGEVEGVKKAHMSAAAKAANCVYKEHMAKLGYQKYPEAQMAMKTGGSTVKKAKGEHVSKSADTSVITAPDLSGVDPKTRAAVELVMKSQQELVAKNATLEASNVELKKSLDEQKAEVRKKELVAKAAGWQHLAIPQDDLVAQLMDADKLGKEAMERVEKSFNTLNSQAKESGLFKEIGSNQPYGASGGPDASWSKIEAAALGWVQKSGEKCSKAEAVSKFLETSEGQRLYAEHQGARKGGV